MCRFVENKMKVFTARHHQCCNEWVAGKVISARAKMCAELIHLKYSRAASVSPSSSHLGDSALVRDECLGTPDCRDALSYPLAMSRCRFTSSAAFVCASGVRGVVAVFTVVSCADSPIVLLSSLGSLCMRFAAAPASCSSCCTSTVFMYLRLT